MKIFLKLTLFIFIIASISLFSGCGKKGNVKDNGGGSSPDSYISFKANGVQKKYTAQAVASIGHSDQTGLFNGVFQGYRLKTGVNDEHIGIVLFSTDAFGNKTYQDPQKATNNNGDEIAVLTINYVDDAGNSYMTMGPMVDKNGNIPSFPGSQNIVADTRVSITKLTTSVVEGTFSGTSALSTDASFSSKVKLTDGKFVLKRIQ